MALPPDKESVKRLQRVLGVAVDGDFGNGTKRACVEKFAPVIDTPKSNYGTGRQAVVNIALSQVGEQDPDKYWAEVCPALKGNPSTISWCGGFALWCLREAGLVNWNWIQGLGFTEVVHNGYRLPKVKRPEPGDIAVYQENWHHAIVERVSADGLYVWVINGNGMRSPKEGVTLTPAGGRKTSEAFAYYSLRDLV
jgi:hypothetical protein